MLGNQQVAGLLASRICHDLVSPVGAIANGTDLIREIGNGDVRDEVTMIGQSASRASTLLQFYRIAFGSANGEDAELSDTELRRHADRMIASEKIQLEWDLAGTMSIPRASGRLLYLMLMCARAVLGLRGRITIRATSDGAVDIALWPKGVTPGAVAQPNENLLALLAQKPKLDDITPRLVEFALIHECAAAARARLNVTQHDGGVYLCASTALATTQ